MTAGGLPAPPVAGTEVTDRNAILIGYVLGIYPEPVTGVAQWASLTLAPGTDHVILLPLGEAAPVFGGIQVPYQAGYIQHAPPAPRTETLSEADLTAAIDFYFSAPAALPREDPPDAPEATIHADADEEDLVVTRSEEQLRTATQIVPVRRLRLHKYIVTEEHTITVQLRREEFRIEEVPADPTVPAGHGEADTHRVAEDDHGVTMVLYAERPLIATEVVPVERIHVSKYLVTDTQVVAATLGHEVVEQVHDAAPIDAAPIDAAANEGAQPGAPRSDKKGSA